MNLYLGNLSFDAKEEDIQELFGQFGEVQSVKIIRDSYSGKSRGFAFVEMDSDEAGEKAQNELNESEFMGRKILVNKARQQRNSDSE